MTIRLAGVLRPMVHAGIAGAPAGLLVGGIDGRIVMRVSAITCGPDVVGAITENGATVGEITAEGNAGAAVVRRPVLRDLRRRHPRRCCALLRWAGAVRGLVFGVFVLAVASPAVIDASNADFVILQPAWLNLVMFSALFLLFGVAAVFPARPARATAFDEQGRHRTAPARAAARGRLVGRRSHSRLLLQS